MISDEGQGVLQVAVEMNHTLLEQERHHAGSLHVETHDHAHLLVAARAPHMVHDHEVPNDVLNETSPLIVVGRLAETDRFHQTATAMTAHDPQLGAPILMAKTLAETHVLVHEHHHIVKSIDRPHEKPHTAATHHHHEPLHLTLTVLLEDHHHLFIQIG